MTPFQSIAVLQRPRQELWCIMRDHLVEFATQIADIDSVRELSREAAADGTVAIANEWRVRQQLPPAVQGVLQTDELGWIDRNVWDEATWICSWSIEPNVLRDQITCSGQTVFTPTMAGRGTRVSFSGELDLKAGALAALGGMASLAHGFIESTVSTIIPRNLRGVAEAAAAFTPR